MTQQEREILKWQNSTAAALARAERAEKVIAELKKKLDIATEQLRALQEDEKA